MLLYSSWLLIPLLAFAIVAGATPVLALGWAHLRRGPRATGLRHMHTREVARVGGLAILLGFGAASTHAELDPRLCGVYFGTLIVTGMGALDDLRGLSPRTKLGMQFVAVLVAVSVGLRWHTLEVWTGSRPFASIGTMLYLLLVMNAFNLIDGLNGLAGKLAVVALGTLTVAASLPGELGDPALVRISVLAMAAIAGFLIHNRNTARAFLGDSGAYGLGFLVGSLSIVYAPDGPSAVLARVWFPLSLVAVPLLDVGLAVARRTIRGFPIFSADGDHLHHRLVVHRRTTAGATRVLVVASLLLSGLGLASLLGRGGPSTAVLASAIIVGLPAMVGYHRLLAKGWRRRRHDTRLLLARIATLERSLSQHGEHRWSCAARPLLEVLRPMGVEGIEVVHAGRPVAKAGVFAPTSRTLSNALSGWPRAEVRMALRDAAPEFARQAALIDRGVAALTGAPPRRRGWAARLSLYPGWTRTS